MLDRPGADGHGESASETFHLIFATFLAGLVGPLAIRYPVPLPVLSLQALPTTQEGFPSPDPHSTDVLHTFLSLRKSGLGRTSESPAASAEHAAMQYKPDPCRNSDGPGGLRRNYHGITQERYIRTLNSDLREYRRGRDTEASVTVTFGVYEPGLL